MYKIILILLALKSLIFSSDIYLKDFVNVISTSLNITIVIDNEVNNQLSIFVADDLKKDSYLKILAEILNENELTIKSFNNFYLITKLKKEDDIVKDMELKILRTIKLNNIDFDYIKDIFTVQKDIEFTYIKTSKLIIINSIESDFKKIFEIVSNIDNSPNQLKLKITILDTNLNKIKEYGSEITQNINLNPSSNFFFNLLAYPFSVNSQVNTTDKSNFNSFIKLLNQNKITELVASPTLTLLDSKEVVFNVVKNIPYLSGSTTVDDTNTKTTNSYTYKDIGLKISITPKIFDDNVFLDLDLTTESILDNTTTPTTSKSFINQSFTMTKNKLFVLTGINQTQKYNDLQTTPFLSDIPVLGWFFKTDEDEYTNSNLTIVFELINEDEYTNNDFNVVVPVDFKSNKDLDHEKRVNQILGK
jgi:general secretion pathway protein D